MNVLSPPPEELARKLLSGYPFKGYQFRLLGLQSDNVVDHHLARLMAASTTAAALQDGDRAGLISLTENRYLSQQLDCPAHRLENFLRTDYDDIEICREMVEHYRGLDEAQGFGEAWLPLDDIVGVDALLSGGFYQVGVEIRLARRLTPEFAPKYPEGLDMRPYEPADEPALKALCAEYHEKNRFAFDPRLDSEVRKRIYVEELSTLLKSPNIRCTTYWEDGNLVGFNTGKINRQLTDRTGTGYGSLDLIVLHPEARRKGAGIGLSLAALEWLRDQGVTFVACRTMASNYPAIALLQTLEFRIVFAKVILHRWGRPESA